MTYTVCEYPGCYEFVSRIVRENGRETGYCDFHADKWNREPDQARARPADDVDWLAMKVAAAYAAGRAEADRICAMISESGPFDHRWTGTERLLVRVLTAALADLDAAKAEVRQLHAWNDAIQIGVDDLKTEVKRLRERAEATEQDVGTI